jgi:hypothetical protein
MGTVRIVVHEKSDVVTGMPPPGPDNKITLQIFLLRSISGVSSQQNYATALQSEPVRRV